MSGQGVEAYAYLKRQTARKVAATGNYDVLPFLSHNIVPDEPLTEERTLGIGQGRDPDDPDTDVLTVAGDIVVPLYLHSIGHFMNMLLGEATTTGGGSDFIHVWKSGKWDVPIYTLEMQTPRHDHSHRMDQILDLQANTVSLQLATGGVERMSFSMLAGDMPELTATGAGIPTAVPAPATRLLRKLRTINLDGAPIGRIMAGTLTYSNNLDPQTYLTNQTQEVDLGLATLTGSLDLRFDTDILLNKAAAGTPVNVSLEWEISPTKYFELSFPRVWLKRTGLPITGPGGIQQSFQIRGSKDQTTAAMVKATLKNQTGSYA